MPQPPGHRFQPTADSLCDRLGQLGAEVLVQPAIKESLEEGTIDWVTVTSSAIAKSLVRLFGDDLRRAKLASISPIASNTLRSLGHEPSAEATEYTMDGVVDAILSAEHQ